VKIIQPSFEIRTPWGLLTPERGTDLLQWIEFNGRISHRSEDAQTPTSWMRFINAVVLGHGDWSIVEHASVTVIFRVDRGTTHQLVRHRLFSFTQESTRFVNYAKTDKTGQLVREMEFVEPVWSEGFIEHGNLVSEAWLIACDQAEQDYLELVQDLKAAPQTARSVLPNSLAATISVTGNLRNWRHFLLMRTSRETQVDFRRVTIPLLAEFKRCIPLLYDDIVPDERQIDNLKKPR
jgi:thymidylate synthase (FAD)